MTLVTYWHFTPSQPRRPELFTGILRPVIPDDPSYLLAFYAHSSPMTRRKLKLCLKRSFDLVDQITSHVGSRFGFPGVPINYTIIQHLLLVSDVIRLYSIYCLCQMLYDYTASTACVRCYTIIQHLLLESDVIRLYSIYCLCQIRIRR